MTKLNDNYVVDEDYDNYNFDRDFITLDAWKRSREVKLFFYKKILPKVANEEKYNLGAQIRQASISITANIAEGYGRYHYQESIQFYRISRASLYELKDHLISCSDLDFITEKEFKSGIHLIESAKIALNGFINYIKRKAR